MIDLTKSPVASPLVHDVPVDPGMSWVKDARPAIEPPPDEAVADPRPEARWPAKAVRTGVSGVVSPRVVRLRQGGYRLFYTQILPRPDFPDGANDYENSTARILSAASIDGETWTPEPGVRLSPQQGGAGDWRVASSEVVPVAGDSSRLRMYYEACPGTQSQQNSIRSAVSDDEGLTWSVEPGTRLQVEGENFMAARIVFLDERRSRLYCCQRGVGIVSAVSDDGLVFRQEPGVRIAQDGPFDRVAAFACDIVRLPSGAYAMYYAGYAAANRAYILRADSEDGLSWRKAERPVVSPGPAGAWDAVKSSEVSLFRLPGGDAGSPRFRMVYEACDGTAKGERGVWRIAGATSAGVV
ncbi:MAG: hypothetical protein NTW19_07025 [Planctomycetota bacterium]|nr:hypothetical protein [Planctomycetota bacterium]